MTEITKDIFTENKSGDLSAKEYIFKYLAYWPLFLLSMVLCLFAGRLYVNYTVVKYQASALILVKQTANEPHSSNDLVKSALTGEAKDNVDNEIQLLRSRALFERVVTKNQFNISYYKEGKLKRTNLYLDAPFRLIPQNLKPGTPTQVINIQKINNDAITATYGTKENLKTLHLKWNAPFSVNGNEFVLVPHGKLLKNDGDYVAVWNPVDLTASDLLQKVTVDMLDKKTSIIQFNILSENLTLGEDILDAISKEFIQTDIDEKNTASQNTIRFIDDRLDIISQQLSGVEGNLENFQGNNDLINVTNQTSQSFANTDAVSKSLRDINIQLGVVEMVRSYFSNPGNKDKLVPSSLGIDDATLIALINRYNDLQLTKERQTPLLGVNSILLTDLNNQINASKGSILESLQNISKDLILKQGSLEQQNQQYTQFLSSLPHKERMMQEIKRKQSITEGLYLYLLQKREETIITASSSNFSIYKQIDPAKGYGPVQPNATYALGYSIVLGLLLPITLIRLRLLLNDKITARSEITNKLTVPVLGELAHIAKNKTNGFAVMGRDLVGEQFRIIRTNIGFLKKFSDKNVFLVTSSSVNEGKSLTSVNLAAVLAMPGKRVALLEFDLRNPGVSKNLGIDNSIGIANYLTGQTNNTREIYQAMEAIPSLHVYPSGANLQYPADFLIGDKMPLFFDELKKQYDYIIIDSAPLGLVTDALILARYADAVIYIVRLRQTLKKQLDFMNDIFKAKKLENVGIIINDVKTGRKHGYGYGYGKVYNYNYSSEKKRGFFKRSKPVLN